MGSTTYLIVDDSATANTWMTGTTAETWAEATSYPAWGLEFYETAETATRLLKELEEIVQYELAPWEYWQEPAIKIPYVALQRPMMMPILFRKTPAMRTKYFRGRRADK